MIPGNAGDATGALELVEQAEENTGLKVSETIGDCAYGGGETRQGFADAERTLYAKVPKESGNGGLFPKSSFTIDLESNTVTCPAGNTCAEYESLGNGRKAFRFGAVCVLCSLRSQCTHASGSRTISVHPQEALISEAREFRKTPEGRAILRERVEAEHGLARLAQLGIGQARYIGIAKMRFQLLMAAAIANFRRAWNWESVSGGLRSVSERVSPALGAVQHALDAVLTSAGRSILHMLSKIVCPSRVGTLRAVPSALA